MVDKNLFPYDLAVVAIFKDEAPYLREWLDYHLLAGVEHFYLYNNDSTDGYAEILKPYVDANIVTLIDWSGKIMQAPAYNDAVIRFKFFCRYIAFVDLDEFIYPKSGQSIAEVVDGVLSRDETAAALGINWQCFGSNGQETADFSRGVLERFTRRALVDWVVENDENIRGGNTYIKSVANPRLVDYFCGPHYAVYFQEFKAINSNGAQTWRAGSSPVAADKIVVNHYYTKSREEFFRKINRSDACFPVNSRDAKRFMLLDRNEVFDDSILTYRDSRIQNFSLTDDAQRFQRAEKVLVDTLTQCSPFEAPAEFFVGKLETFLTCRRLAQHFGTRIDNRSAEEYALVWLYQTLTRAETLTYAEVQMFLKALPEILSRPLPLAKKFLRLTQEVVIPSFCEMLKTIYDHRKYSELVELQKFLRLIK